MYGGTSALEFGFPIHFKEYVNGHTLDLFQNLTVEAVPVIHSEASNPHAIRIAVAEKSIVYTGDTEWTDELLLLSNGCDILISECFGWDGPMKYHLSYQEIIANFEKLDAKRVYLTHLGPEAYSRQSEMKLEVLKPGQEIVI
jgi:ribonuclease BN (tRNA processing enzyme)